MFCLPPSEGAIAWAYVNSKYSYYVDKWCGHISAQMHEVGHNLDLAHSGVDKDEYADQTGFMGYASGLDDERMCFNQEKNYQLGWCSDKVKTINPVDGEGTQ
jgi:hypothetical protein